MNVNMDRGKIIKIEPVPDDDWEPFIIFGVYIYILKLYIYMCVCIKPNVADDLSLYLIYDYKFQSFQQIGNQEVIEVTRFCHSLEVF